MKTLIKPTTKKTASRKKKKGKKATKAKPISSGNKALDEAIKSLFGNKKNEPL